MTTQDNAPLTPADLTAMEERRTPCSHQGTASQFYIWCTACCDQQRTDLARCVAELRRRMGEKAQLGLPAPSEPEDIRWTRGCLLSGPGRGDCQHFIGLPPILDDTTTDEYGRPMGWCQICWDGLRLERSQIQLHAAQQVVEQVVAEDYIVCSTCAGGGADGHDECDKCHGHGMFHGDRLKAALAAYHQTTQAGR